MRIPNNLLKRIRQDLDRLYYKGIPPCRIKKGPSDNAIRAIGFIKFYPKKDL